VLQKVVLIKARSKEEEEVDLYVSNFSKGTLINHQLSGKLHLGDEVRVSEETKS
jgi:hypothetical protein